MLVGFNEDRNKVNDTVKLCETMIIILPVFHPLFPPNYVIPRPNSVIPLIVPPPHGNDSNIR